MKKTIYENNIKKEQIKEFIKENKSMIILDTQKEYEEMFNNSNYEVIKLDIKDFNNSIKYNPLLNANILYKEGKIDKAIEKILLFANLLYKNDKSMDPYWDNAAKNIFIGISLYLLENNKELNLKEIIKVSISEFDEFKNYINKQDVLSTINIITSTYINVPKETLGGIIAVLGQKLGIFAHRPSLLDNICTMDQFEIKEKNQVILLTNLEQPLIYNIIIDYFICNTIEDMIDNKKEYTFILDNFDTVYDKTIYNTLINSSKNNKLEYVIKLKDKSFLEN